MDVNVVNYTTNKPVTQKPWHYDVEETIAQLEKQWTEMDKTDKFIDFEALRTLASATRKMQENAKKNKNDDEIAKELLKGKKSILENMLKTARMLRSTTYTKESWKKSMAEVEKAVMIAKNSGATGTQVNAAIRHMRVAMSKLRPATKTQEPKGKENDRKRAFSRMHDDKIHDPKKTPELSETDTSTIDVTTRLEIPTIENSSAIIETV